MVKAPSRGKASREADRRDGVSGEGREDSMTRMRALIFVLMLVATAGCANMTAQQQRALSGGAMGAAGGAALGAVVGGNPALGAAVGGAVGAAAGALWQDITKPLK
jgi:osmotically inducible lipoprotein OsmB